MPIGFDRIEGCAMLHWPQTIPPDLRRKLENVMGYRQFGPQDLWGEIREWLVAHGVDAPEELPEDDRK